MTQDELLDRFFEQARAVLLGERDSIDLSGAELVQLVSNDVLRLRFRHRFRREVQDPDLRLLVITYLAGIAAREEELAGEAKLDADGIDRYVERVAIGATTAGVAAIISTGGVGALVLLFGGLIGLSLGGATSHRMKKRALRRDHLARRLRLVLSELTSDD